MRMAGWCFILDLSGLASVRNIAQSQEGVKDLPLDWQLHPSEPAHQETPIAHWSTSASMPGYPNPILTTACLSRSPPLPSPVSGYCAGM